MARKTPCVPFQSQGSCCLVDLEFIQQQDITKTTDIIIILDNSGSFNSSRVAFSAQIDAWYQLFRASNPDYEGTIFFYPDKYDPDKGYSTGIPFYGTKTDSTLRALHNSVKVSATTELPLEVVYSIQVYPEQVATYDNSIFKSQSWDIIMQGLYTSLQEFSSYTISTRLIDNEIYISHQNTGIIKVNNLTKSAALEQPLLTSLYADGLDYSTNYSLPSNFISDENWLNFPKKIKQNAQKFTDLGFNNPDEVLLIYLGDEMSVGGAYYHGPNLIIDNASGYNRSFADLQFTQGYSKDELNAATGVIYTDFWKDNAIQTKVLSDPYRTVTLPYYGETVVGGGYKEHYEEFTQIYYNQYKFFRGIVYGVSTNNAPSAVDSLSTINICHSFIYQAIEPSTVSEENFIESSYALDNHGNPTGLTLEFIKTRNYLAEQGYGGLRDYGWKEYHNVGYGSNVTDYFTAEIFQANIEKALTGGSTYILRGTLSNGLKIDSNPFEGGGTVKTSVSDVTTGTLAEKIVAGENVSIAVVDNKLEISSKGGGEIEEELIVTVNIANAGYQKGDAIHIGTTTTEFVKTLLCPYTPPSFSAFTVNFNVSGSVEVGRTVSITNATYSTTLDSLSNPPSDINITGTGYDPTIFIASSPVATNSTPITTVKNTASSEGWTIAGKTAENITVSRAFNKVWQYMHRFGSSNLIITDASSAQAVIDSLAINTLTSGKARTVTCTADNNNIANYTYISYDASYGALSGIIQNGALPVLTAFTRLPDYSYINQYGVTRTVITYVSNSTGAFANGTTLAIT